MPTAIGRRASVQFSDPEAPDGADTTAAKFLAHGRQAALARFHRSADLRTACKTMVHVTRSNENGPSGTIVMHVNLRAFDAWKTAVDARLGDRANVVETQVLRVMAEIAQQGLQGYLAFTDSQRQVFSQDLSQAVAEALGRTSFAKLGRKASVHWEGTLVERVRPPRLILVISLDF